MDSQTETMTELEKTLNEYKEDARTKLKDSDENVVLLGNTGVGKSTIFCGLRGDKLEGTQNQRLKMIIKSQDVLDTTIGQTQESQTKKISCLSSSIWKQNQNVLICDTPGFSDTGSKTGNVIGNDSGLRNIINQWLIMFTLKFSARTTILIVLDFNSYQTERETIIDPLSILNEMIPNLDQMYSSIGILINKVDQELKPEDVIKSISYFYEEKKQMKISELIQKFDKDKKIEILYRPPSSLKNQTLASSYFDKVSQLIQKLEGMRYFNLKSVLLNHDSRLFIKTYIEQHISELYSFFSCTNLISIPSLIDKKLEEKQKIRNQIEQIQFDMTQLINNLIKNQNNERQVENTFIALNNILNFLSDKLIDSHRITIPFQKIMKIQDICEIEKEEFEEFQKYLYINFKNLLQQYIKISTETILRDDQLQYPLPKETPKFQILVCRKPKQNGYLESGFDLLLTLGNACFEEHYFVLIQRNNGELYVEKRIYQNEYNLASFRGITEFDHTEYYKQKLQLFENISELNQTKSNEKLKKYYSDQIVNIFKSDEISKIQLEKAAVQIAKNVVGAAIIGNVTFITVKETFKIVNNVLVKEGIKGFLAIGGKKMMVEGAKVIVTQAGKQIVEGVVVQVTKESLVIGTKAAVGVAASFGLNVLGSATLGVAKSVINSKWINQTEYICSVLCKDFQLDILDQNQSPEEAQEQQTSQQQKD